MGKARRLAIGAGLIWLISAIVGGGLLATASYNRDMCFDLLNEQPEITRGPWEDYGGPPAEPRRYSWEAEDYPWRNDEQNVWLENLKRHGCVSTLRDGSIEWHRWSSADGPNQAIETAGYIVAAPAALLTFIAVIIVPALALLFAAVRVVKLALKD